MFTASKEVIMSIASRLGINSLTKKTNTDKVNVYETRIRKQ